MLQSELFTKTRREAPKDEVAKNAELLIRAGYIHKEMAGVYAYLPLGLRVQNKIKEIVREEMNNIGGQEIIMTALQRKELWQQTKRWDDETVDIWFKSSLKTGAEVGFGWSHEEPIADMMKNYVSSFRDLPIFVYQFQTKLRNELRVKSGIMRGREFVMKDMYSFCLGEEDHTKFYNETIDAYMRVYNRVGIGDDTFVTFASGGAFTQFSHEFQTLVETGEDTIYLNKEKKIAINNDVLNEETLHKLGITRNDLEEVHTSEVGNIFNFGTRKSEELGLYFSDEKGKKIPVWMGSYGIGITRLMGLLVEKFADEKGIVWPASVAPFDVHLIEISGKDEKVKKAAQKIYKKFEEKGTEVLYDDRDIRAGEKFADADLIGIPRQIIISERGLADDSAEVKDRKTGKVTVVKLKDLK
jgi:prolyl-tRNA synthetase